MMTTASGEEAGDWSVRDIAVPAVCGLLVLVLFAWHVGRYYFLGDDCFISFRYAQNLIAGNGLVYNAGERVEGYTNFLWVMMMAGAMRLGLAPELVSNVLGIASGVVILAALVRLGARSSGWGDPLVWIAPLCLSVNRTFCAWSTSGLETQFFAMLVLLAVLRFCSERQRGVKRPVVSSLLFAAATLTRPDGALYFGVAACFFAFEVVVLRRRRFVPLAVWLVPYVVIVGAHVAWRYSYYGFVVPNTFYVKVSGLWWEQAGTWLGLFVGEYHLLLLCPLLVLAFVCNRNYLTLLSGGLLAAHAAYMVYIGGDRFEFRFMTTALPYLYWLLQEGVRGLVRWWKGRDLSRQAGLAGGVVLGALLIGATYLPNSAEPIRGRDNYGIGRIEYFKRYATRRKKQGDFLRTLVKEGYLTGDEWLAVGGAGALPYYSGFPTIDFRGLNDVHIAHQEIEQRGWVGHEKVASLEYLRQRGVAIYDVCNRIVLFEKTPEDLLLVRPEDRVLMGVSDDDGVLERPDTPGAPWIWRRDFYEGPIRCVKAKGYYLIFATTLSEADFRETFSRFQIVF